MKRILIMVRLVFIVTLSNTYATSTLQSNIDCIKQPTSIKCWADMKEILRDIATEKHEDKEKENKKMKNKEINNKLQY